MDKELKRPSRASHSSRAFEQPAFVANALCHAHGGDEVEPQRDDRIQLCVRLASYRFQGLSLESLQATKRLKKNKLQRRARRGQPIRQVAALPYRHTANGDMEILLLTSRQTRRFILPKGWPMKGLRDCETAAQEAVEEAGVIGSSHEIPVGSFRYWKRLKRSFVSVDVKVYPLYVEQELDTWKERKSRQRAWFKLDQAALLVDEPGLVTILETVDIPSRSIS